MIKVGIVGTGSMGMRHLQSLLKIKEVNIVGVSDGKNIKKNIVLPNNIKYFFNVDELLKKVDLVDICLPTHLHLYWIEKAAKIGKDIICEKPLSRTLAEAEKIVKICQEKNVKLMVAHVLRFFPEYVLAHQIITSGEIGKSAVIRTSRGASYPRGSSDWYGDEAKSGGVILDMMIHDFDFIYWCFGEIDSVFSRALTYRSLKGIDYALVLLRLKNGAIAHSEGSWAYPAEVPFRHKLEVAGTKGLLEMNKDASLPTRIYLRNGEEERQRVVVPEIPLAMDPYEAQLRHFVECLKVNRQPKISLSDAIYSLKISLAALNSAKSGKPVSI